MGAVRLTRPPPERRRAEAGRARAAGAVNAVLALQRAAGNRAVARQLQRSFTPAPGGGWTVAFTVGTEIDRELAGEAYRRTASGPLTDADLGDLRAVALQSGRSVDDHERLFLAALLDAGNAVALHRAHPSGFAAAATFSLAGSAITADARDRVKDFGRDATAPSMAIGVRPPKVKDRITALGGAAFAATTTGVLALAAAGRIRLGRVETAMRAAASDSTPGDRAMAGAAYVIAVRAGLPVAADLLTGSIKVDEVPASAIDGATAVYRSLGGAGKGDTIYLPTTFDVGSVAYQGLLVHELTHAAHDKAATAFGSVDRWREELDGYRAQGRYWLRELSKLRPRARPPVIAQLAAAANPLSVLAMLLEQRAANDFAWWGFLEEINRTSPNGLSVTDFGNANLDTDAALERRALRAIRTHPTYAAMGANAPVDGLRGESFLDE